MGIQEIQAKTILRKQKKIDSWFIAPYGMNLYRGCAHNCVYCDGRFEKYRVTGDFGRDIEVKVNAHEILLRELDPRRKRKPMKQGYIFIGGGVSDSYQPAEETYRLTRKVLGLIDRFQFPVHILTKSTLVNRDTDILQTINEKTRAMVSFSLSSSSEHISRILEPGVPSPAERLNTLSTLRKRGIHGGIYLMPVIPFITDEPKTIDQTVMDAKNAGAEFVIFAGLTLKEGRQQDYFYDALRKHFPHLLPEYKKIYPGNRWGEARPDYHAGINGIFHRVASRYRVPVRIPSKLFTDLISETDRVIVILEQLDYLLQSKGEKSPHGYAAYTISKLDKPVRDYYDKLSHIRGIGPKTAGIIREILDTGTTGQYRYLMDGERQTEETHENYTGNP